MATAFAERGFHATTTRDIAAQAGLSSAALYFYFRSEEEVLYQIATSALDFTIDLVATEAKSAGSPAERLTNLVRVLTIWHTYNSQVAHVVPYQTGALTPAHLAEVAAKQRLVSQVLRQVIADGVTSGDFDMPDTGAATIAVLSLCLDVARWYRPGYRLTPQQLGDFNASPPSVSPADTRRPDLPRGSGRNRPDQLSVSASKEFAIVCHDLARRTPGDSGLTVGP